MQTNTTTISLLDFNNNVKPVTNLWIAGVGYPAGKTFLHDPESDGEDFCDVNEVIELLGLWNLEGTVVDGRWEWNGEGNPTDTKGNTIYNVKAQ